MKIFYVSDAYPCYDFWHIARSDGVEVLCGEAIGIHRLMIGPKDMQLQGDDVCDTCAFLQSYKAPESQEPDKGTCSAQNWRTPEHEVSARRVDPGNGQPGLIMIRSGDATQPVLDDDDVKEFIAWALMAIPGAKDIIRATVEETIAEIHTQSQGKN